MTPESSRSRLQQVDSLLTSLQQSVSRGWREERKKSKGREVWDLAEGDEGLKYWIRLEDWRGVKKGRGSIGKRLLRE